MKFLFLLFLSFQVLAFTPIPSAISEGVISSSDYNQIVDTINEKVVGSFRFDKNQAYPHNNSNTIIPFAQLDAASLSSNSHGVTIVEGTSFNSSTGNWASDPYFSVSNSGWYFVSVIFEFGDNSENQGGTSNRTNIGMVGQSDGFFTYRFIPMGTNAYPISNDTGSGLVYLDKDTPIKFNLNTSQANLKIRTGRITIFQVK